MSVTRTIIEKPQGWGQLRLADATIIPTRYYLVVTRVVDDIAVTNQLGSRTEVRGTIEVSGKQRGFNLEGKQLTLALNDGRCLVGKIGGGNVVTGLWQIIAVDNSGLTPC